MQTGDKGLCSSIDVVANCTCGQHTPGRGKHNLSQEEGAIQHAVAVSGYNEGSHAFEGLN